MALELAREAARQVHGLPDLETGPAGAGEGEGDVLDLLD
jgi:hypothetical protein